MPLDTLVSSRMDGGFWPKLRFFHQLKSLGSGDDDDKGAAGTTFKGGDTWRVTKFFLKIIKITKNRIWNNCIKSCTVGYHMLSTRI